MAKQARDPFDVSLDDNQRKTLALWLSRELQAGLDARASNENEVDYWHSLYEQARTRLGHNVPWPDAADLTSYLPCEKVDALHARAMRTVWVEPVWTVEGWGDAADRAPFVEEFHQWKAEEERLQSVLDKLLMISLIEPRGLLEVYEGSDWRVSRKRINAKLQTDPETGGAIYNDKGEPQFVQDGGKYVEAQPNDPQGQLLVDSLEKVRIGPAYRVIPYRDSVILPGHAREKEEIFCYGKRLWKRYPDILAMAAGPHAIYDFDTASQLTATSDRGDASNQGLVRSRTDVAPTDEILAEKELWELLILLDLKYFYETRGMTAPRGLKDGARWYVCTLHADDNLLLRIQHDDMERGRFVPVILFPRPDRATEGFSFVGHKLITTTEEHTAYRNMAADRSAMANAVPVKRMQGALWDPVEQPWGPKAVIDVRDMREIEPVQVPDVPASVFQHITNCERTAERLAGVNDVASGQVAQESRTLGEVQMATEQSFVRMDLVVRRFQEAMEDLFQIRHAIWKRVLAEQPDGMDAPQSLIVGMEGRGVPVADFMPNQKITADMLDGSFRGKPHGSVETADNARLRADFVSAMQALPMLLQAFPMLQAQFRSEAAGRAMGRTFLRVFRVGNAQAFLGSAAQDIQQQIQAGLPPGPPGVGAPGVPVPAGMPPLGAMVPPPAGVQ